MRIRCITLATAALSALLSSPLHAQEKPKPRPVAVSEPVLEQLPEAEGTGLCAASAISTSPAGDFLPDFTEEANEFIDTHSADRLEYVI
ncbi:hypothetical protein WME89_21415 [Sorangium sp. So ce321]